MKDLTPEEAGRWMTAAPPLIQEAVTSEETQKIVEEIGQKYTLHVDAVGLLLKLTSYMLLGYAGPEEVLKDLLAIGISDVNAKEIITEINQKIFVPLREQMRNGGVVAKTPAPPVAWKESVPQAPRAAPVNANVPSYAYMKPKQSSPPYFHLENKIPHAPPKATQGTAPPKIELQQKMLPKVEPNTQTKMLEDHEEPHIELNELKKVLTQVVPEQVAPLRVAEVRQIEKVDKAEVPKHYVADPYREPIDEK